MSIGLKRRQKNNNGINAQFWPMLSSTHYFQRVKSIENVNLVFQVDFGNIICFQILLPTQEAFPPRLLRKKTLIDVGHVLNYTLMHIIDHLLRRHRDKVILAFLYN